MSQKELLKRIATLEKKLDKQLQSAKPKSKDFSGQCSTSSKELISLRIPIRVYSEANVQQHWTKKYKRKKEQQRTVKLFWNQSVAYISPPVAVTLIRLAPRTLDDDNLVSGFKWIRDCVADLLVPGLQAGRADDNEGLSFSYAQRKSKEYAVEILLQKDTPR